MRGCIRLGVLVVGAWLTLGTSEPAVAGVLDRPAFTAPPAELLAAGKAAATDDRSAVVLRDEHEVSLDEEGRATVRWRRVYVVQADDEEDWSEIYASWRASYQDRPVVRARVISPTGAVTELDPALVTDAPRRATGAARDRRHLQARLPTLQRGAVVEQQITTVDREPLWRPGVVATTVLDSWLPVSSTLITYSAPAKRVRPVERRLPAGTRKRHHVAGGRETWSYEIGALPARAGVQLGVPHDVVVSPYVGIATAASWEAVARGYRKQLDQQIAAGPFDLPAELPRAATIEAVHAIAAWVHRKVRSTEVPFGEGPLVPLTPAEAVQRATGNGLDKAALLLALLRQAGLRADLVLVDTQVDFDTEPGHGPDPDLPGMGVFGHALVRTRIAGRDVWIDPTEELARPGQLAEQALGRRALVIADDTRGLSVTPAPAPADNLIREVRTFVASEAGPAQLTQVISSRGVFDIEQRHRVRDARGDALKTMLEHAVSSVFVGTLERFTSTSAEDLSQPFELTLTVKDAHRVYTDREQIDIYLHPVAALAELPWMLMRQPDVARTHDFVWSRAHTYEVENRIVLPPGFAPPAPEPERIRRLGTATLSERRSVDGQTLIVAFRFDSGKQRLTPAELTALQTAVAELKDEVLHIKVEQKAFTLSHAGKHREAIAECERLIALHPKEAVHRQQLAMVLLRAGVGEAARREARKAVALAPGDADPLAVLGWVLSFDTLGRQYSFDWDRAGALAALEQARKLDPRHRGAAVELALVLQRDREGQLFEAGADLRGAAEAWRASLALEKLDEHALALAQVLLWSGQFAEAEKVARTAAATEERDRWIVAAVAGRAGGAAAIRAASDLRSGASRLELLKMAGWSSMMLRQYDAGRALLTESGALAQLQPAVAAIVQKVTSQPAHRSGTGDPRVAVLDVFFAMNDPHHRTPVFWDDRIERELRGSGGSSVPPPMRGAGMRRLSTEMLQATVTVTVEGDAGLWRATLEDSKARFHLYLALDRGVAKVLGATDRLGGVGRYVLALAGDARAGARARRLLDWAHADSGKATSPAILSFRKLWGPGTPTSREAILLAAAVLAGGSDADRAIAIASRCASTLPDAPLMCHEVLRAAYIQKERWSEAVTQVEAILRLKPGRALAMAMQHAWLLGSAGRLDEADLLLDGILAKDRAHFEALAARFWIGARRSVDEAMKRADAVVNHPNAHPGMLNEIAWYRLGANRDLAGARELVRRAVTGNPRSASAVNTLAAIEAELGELDPAIKNNWKSMELRRTAAPIGSDWYVAGRIAEQLGLRADAEALYKRVPPARDWPLSSYDLAQRRLAALRASP